MMFSPKEAGAAVGMSKQGIIRSIHAGKLSASRNSGGQFEIDPAELFRVYQPLATGVTNGTVVEEEEECKQCLLLERLIRDKEEVIADLRGRLDALQAASEQSQAHISQLSAVIAQLTPAKAKVGWWQRLLGNTG